MANESDRETLFSDNGLGSPKQPGEFEIDDFRGLVECGSKPQPYYKDWPVDDLQVFGQSQLDVVESELEIVKILLLASDVDSAVVYTRGFEVNGIIEPVIVIGVDGEFDYPINARWRPCRIHLDDGWWLTPRDTASYGMDVGFTYPSHWHMYVGIHDTPASGNPISVFCTDDETISEALTGAVVFGYTSTTATGSFSPDEIVEKGAEPDNIYVLTCAHFHSDTHLSIGTDNNVKGREDIRLVFPSYPSPLVKALANKVIGSSRKGLEYHETRMCEARESLITLARSTGIHACLDTIMTNALGTLPIAFREAKDENIRKMADAWLKYQCACILRPQVQESVARKEQRLNHISNAPKRTTIGYARVAELGLVQRAKSPSSLAESTTIPSSLAPPTSTRSPGPSSLSPVLPPSTSTYFDCALFKITDRSIINKLKKRNSSFLPNYGQIEKGMEVGICSWAARKHKSHVDHRAFFVSRTPAYAPKAEPNTKRENLHVFDNGKVTVMAAGDHTTRCLPEYGASGAVVYTKNSTDLDCPVGLCVGVFMLRDKEEKVCLVLPLADVIPHMEAAVQQNLLFSQKN